MVSRYSGLIQWDSRMGGQEETGGSTRGICWLQVSFLQLTGAFSQNSLFKPFQPLASQWHLGSQPILSQGRECPWQTWETTCLQLFCYSWPVWVSRASFAAMSFPFWNGHWTPSQDRANCAPWDIFWSLHMVLHVSSSFSPFPPQSGLPWPPSNKINHCQKITFHYPILFILLFVCSLFLCSTQTKSSIKARSVFW